MVKKKDDALITSSFFLMLNHPVFSLFSFVSWFVFSFSLQDRVGDRGGKLRGHDPLRKVGEVGEGRERWQNRQSTR